VIVRLSLLLFEVVVAALLSADSTCDGLAPVFDERYSAPPPAPWGEAIDVPDIVVVPPFLFVERIETPGAQMSTQLP
jgi:hypothetical protein